MTSINVFLKLTRNAIVRQLVYRANMLLSMMSHAFVAVVAVFSWTAVIGNDGVVGSYNQDELVTYVLLANLVGVLFSVEHFFHLQELVRQGSLNTFLLRPYLFFVDRLARFVGSRLIKACALSLFITIGSLVIPAMEIITPTLLAVVLVILNLGVAFLFGMSISVLSFWLVQMWPIRSIYAALLALSGGTLFPLDLLPESVSTWISYLPFALFAYVNVRALQGGLTESEILRFCGVALSWALFFYILLRWLWPLGLRRYAGYNT